MTCGQLSPGGGRSLNLLLKTPQQNFLEMTFVRLILKRVVTGGMLCAGRKLILCAGSKSLRETHVNPQRKNANGQREAKLWHLRGKLQCLKHGCSRRRTFTTCNCEQTVRNCQVSNRIYWTASQLQAVVPPPRGVCRMLLIVSLAFRWNFPRSSRKSF